MRDKGGITSFTQGRPQRKAFGFLRGKSFCPHCKHTLSWQDLIPVFSFLFLRGKCRYCDKKISFQYPLVEIATGLLFVLILNFKFLILNQFLIFNFETIIYFLYLLIISSFLIIVFVYDLKHFIIPDKVVFPAIGLALLYGFIHNSQFIIHNSFFAAVGASAFFLFIVLVSRGRSMGVGDIKLAFLMGLLLGFPYILVALFFSFLIGAIIGIGLILAKRKTMKSEVPFGPFLVIGTCIALFWGERIIQWYLDLFI
jgi:prepilin signal peptidase PulO-like enzyme (type II secretory pathway)